MIHSHQHTHTPTHTSRCNCPHKVEPTVYTNVKNNERIILKVQQMISTRK